MPTAQRHSAYPSFPVNILFADDRQADLHSRGLRRKLTKRGFVTDITVRTTAESAIAALGEMVFDLVVVDLRFDNSSAQGNDILRAMAGRVSAFVFSAHGGELDADFQARSWVHVVKDKHVTTLARDIGEHLEDEPVIIKLERQLDRAYEALDGARLDSSHERIVQLEEQIDSLKMAQMDALDSKKSALLALDPDDVYQTTDQVLKRHDDDEDTPASD